MTDIAKGILAGGWSLVVGWILPTGINALIFGFFVLPGLRGIALTHDLEQASAGGKTITVLLAASVGGVVLNQLQTPLYRVLEGYLWPGWIAKCRRDHYVKTKRILRKRLELIGYRTDASHAEMAEKRISELESDLEVCKYVKRDRKLTSVQAALRRESIRFPADDSQVAPTRLGNAIRLLETYGFDRYCLDSQVLWYELTAAVPRQLNRKVDTARSRVDFFVCLLYGHAIVAVSALASLGNSGHHLLTPLATAGVLVALTLLWYRLACSSTDEWAFTVRALVNLGRKPLAERLSLCLPRDLQRERKMWLLYTQMVQEPYDPEYTNVLDEFRIAGDAASLCQSLEDKAETSSDDKREGDKKRRNWVWRPRQRQQRHLA
jgi:hypothetical protein